MIPGPKNRFTVNLHQGFLFLACEQNQGLNPQPNGFVHQWCTPSLLVGFPIHDHLGSVDLHTLHSEYKHVGAPYPTPSMCVYSNTYPHGLYTFMLNLQSMGTDFANKMHGAHRGVPGATLTMEH